jgi:prepilin-type N-terminal cleavage/methylation domain-containing protein
MSVLTAMSPAQARSRPVGADGLTLVELLISVTILGIIMMALTLGVMTFLHNAYVTTKRSTHSAGASLLATYLDRDLASASAVTTPPGTACSGATNILAMTWTQWTVPTSGSADPTATGGDVYTVAYDIIPTPTTPGTFQLDRWECVQTGGAGPVSSVSHNVVASQLSASNAFAVVAATNSCPTSATPFAATLTQFINVHEGATSVKEPDATTKYQYAGCLNGRIQ